MGVLWERMGVSAAGTEKLGTQCPKLFSHSRSLHLIHFCLYMSNHGVRTCNNPILNQQKMPLNTGHQVITVDANANEHLLYSRDRNVETTRAHANTHTIQCVAVPDLPIHGLQWGDSKARG